MTPSAAIPPPLSGQVAQENSAAVCSFAPGLSPTPSSRLNARRAACPGDANNPPPSPPSPPPLPPPRPPSPMEAAAAAVLAVVAVAEASREGGWWRGDAAAAAATSPSSPSGGFTGEEEEGEEASAAWARMYMTCLSEGGHSRRDWGWIEGSRSWSLWCAAAIDGIRATCVFAEAGASVLSTETSR